ncbi:hypothetical protein Dimus_034944 [Dionaea muscipula]
MLHVLYFHFKYENHCTIWGGSQDPINISSEMEDVREAGDNGKALTKFLMNVMIQGSLGVIQVIVSPKNTVRDLIKKVLEVHIREKRRPLLSVSDPSCFELHYSQFSLDCLGSEEKLMNLGSRNFFLCQKPNRSNDGHCSKDTIKQRKQ